MSTLILHHYDVSPFSEKVRLVLGFKKLAWRSVTVPLVMPKPDVVALTGGYRRTPFLQIGADIFCDTALVAQVIDELAPTPPLFPREHAGAARMISRWADTELFWTVVAYTGQPAGMAHIFEGHPPGTIEAFIADRAGFAPRAPRPTPADGRAQLLTALDWLSAELADGRPWLCGGQPGIADVSVAHCLWLVRCAGPLAGVLDGHPQVQAWLDRVLAVGHGQAQPMSAADAIAVAAAAEPRVPVEVLPGQGLAEGDPVSVSATDYGTEPVQGKLVGLTTRRIAVQREDPRAGTVTVHFPRLGFQVRRRRPESGA